jgi:hypothetical protein
MIVEWFIGSAFTTVEWLIQLLGYGVSALELGAYMTAAEQLIRVAGQFVPLDMVTLCLGSIIQWLGIHMAISAVRFVLDFIPFF